MTRRRGRAMLSWGMRRLAAGDRAIRDRRINRRRGTLVGASLETCSTMKSMHIYNRQRHAAAQAASSRRSWELSCRAGKAQLAWLRGREKAPERDRRGSRAAESTRREATRAWGASQAERCSCRRRLEGVLLTRCRSWQRLSLEIRSAGGQRSIEIEGRIDGVLLLFADTKQAGIEPNRESGKILTVVRQSNPTVGPMPHRHLTDHTVTREAKAQSQLRSEVPARDTQVI